MIRSVLLLLCLGLAALGAQTSPASFTVSGEVERPLRWELTALRELPDTPFVIPSPDPADPLPCRGIPLWGLLARSGIQADTARKNDRLRRVVVLSARDGYSVTLSVGELDPSVGGSAALLLLSCRGAPLAEERGPVELVVPGDRRRARWIHAVSDISVRTP
jgi:hypothetical protein